MMLVNVGQCPMSVNFGRYQSMLVDVGRCQLMSVNFGQLLSEDGGGFYIYIPTYNREFRYKTF